MLGLRGTPPATAASAARGRCSVATAPVKTGRVSLAIPAAVSLSLVLWSGPVNAGILSGSTGMESVPGPKLPRLEFLEKWNAENQKKYAEFDSRFKSSKVLQELLEKSKQNKQKNERQIQDKMAGSDFKDLYHLDVMCLKLINFFLFQKKIQDKYCLRGAEWGVGDCSTAGMSDQEREDFISELRKRTGGE